MKPIHILEGEEWVDLHGKFEGYSASSFGRVSGIHGKILTGRPDSNGYERVNVRLVDHRLHRLICAGFLPNENPSLCVNHKDGNKANNRPENLEWVTPSENQKHAYRTGLRKRMQGVGHPLSKVNAIDVAFIREYPESKGYQSKLMEMFDLSQSQVSAIRLGRSWKHIPMKAA